MVRLDNILLNITFGVDLWIDDRVDVRKLVQRERQGLHEEGENAHTAADLIFQFRSQLKQLRCVHII